MAFAIESSNERADTPVKIPLKWENIDWNMVEKHVERLKGRIYKATDEGNYRKANNLQKLTIHSFHVKLYAIRQVTTINSGRYTPGIDGKLYSTNADRESLLVLLLALDWDIYRPKPAKRVEIPKPNGTKRPLGIPTIVDRVVQTIVKTALEPEWECKAHGNSFGFRPGRCSQDAIEKIKDTILDGNGEYILDADLSGCFDNIAHAPLLANLHLFKDIVRRWLRCGIYDNGKYYKTHKGTPQGGVISPLLANIALNNLDYRFNGTVTFKGKKYRYKITLIRYADDFVILARDKRILVALLPYLKLWLAERGLRLNLDKTRLVHKSQGFKFLGFNVVQYPGRTLWIRPDKSSIKRHLREIKVMVDMNKQVKIDLLIRRLNSKILGWARYFRYCRMHEAFAWVDRVIFEWIWKWCRRRHPQKGRRWIRRRYFPDVDGRVCWSLTGDSSILAKTISIKRQRYWWRVGTRSQLDPRYRSNWRNKGGNLQLFDLDVSSFPFS